MGDRWRMEGGQVEKGWRRDREQMEDGRMEGWMDRWRRTDRHMGDGGLDGQLRMDGGWREDTWRTDGWRMDRLMGDGWMEDGWRRDRAWMEVG